MEPFVVVLGAALVVSVGSADLRMAVRRHVDDRRAVLARCIGAHLTVVDAADPAGRRVTGLVRGIGRRHVRLRTTGSEVEIPLQAISEIWDGRQLLHRW